MKLKVVATGSAANCYVLYSDSGESLILDAGVPVRQVLPAIPDFRKVSGCLVTHEHNDHARAWQDYSMLGIPDELYTPLFAIARVAGWVSHNMENKLYDGRIMRPATKYVGELKEFKPINER